MRCRFVMLVTLGMGFAWGCKRPVQADSAVKGLAPRAATVATKQELLAFLDESVDLLSQKLVTTTVSNRALTKSPTLMLQTIDACLANRSLLAEAPGAELALGRLRAFLLYYSRFGNTGSTLAHTDQTGALISNAEYLSAVRGINELPTWLNDPEMLKLINMTDPNVGKNVNAKLAEINKTLNRTGDEQLSAVLYKAGDGASGGTTAPERLFLPIYPTRASGSKKTQIAQFSGNNVSVISVVPTDDGRYESFFEDQTVTSSGLKQLPEPLFGNACAICHQSGSPLAIIPTNYEALDPSASEALDRYNEKIPEWGLGFSATFDRTRLLLPQDFPGLGKQARATKSMSSAENCWSCHNDKKRARLLPPFGPAITAFILNGHMPPLDAPESAEERKRLWEKLETDYTVAFVSYFKDPMASAASTTVP